MLIKSLKILLLSVLMLFALIIARTLLYKTAGDNQTEVVAVEVDEAAIVKNMSSAIRFQTISSGNPQTQQYQAFDDFIEWLLATYPEFSASLDLHRIAEYTLLFKWQGSDPTLKPILLTSHYDVVPVVPGSELEWQHPPFSGDIADGYVWGRGALDDKSSTIGMLEAATMLIKQGFKPERTIFFSFGHDEETGGVLGAAGVARHLKDQQVQLAWSLDEGSFIVSNALPGFKKPVAMINVAEKGSVTLELTASGQGGHSSMPAAEVPIDILANALVSLRKQPLPGGLEGVSDEMFDAIAANGPFIFRLLAANKWLFRGLIEKQLSSVASTNAMIRTTTAPTILNAGIKTNVISPTAKAAINFRIHPRDTPESIKAHVIRAVNDDRVKVEFRQEGLGSLASAVSSRDSSGYQKIADVSRQIYGDVVVVPGLTVAGTDSKHYAKVADNSYRYLPMVISLEDLKGFHGTNERVSIENLVKGTSAYYLLIKQASVAD